MGHGFSWACKARTNDAPPPLSAPSQTLGVHSSGLRRKDMIPRFGEANLSRSGRLFGLRLRSGPVLQDRHRQPPLRTDFQNRNRLGTVILISLGNEGIDVKTAMDRFDVEIRVGK